MKRYLPLIATILTIAACQDSTVPTAGPADGQAPVLSMAPQQGPLADRYIVVFKPSVSDVDGEIDRAVQGFGAQVHYRYYSALKGFAATLPAPALEGLSRNPNVDYIEADGVMTADAVGSWGLDRIDQRSLPLDNSYSPPATGAGVTAYIIDTGILFTHVDFGGRASSGYDAVDGGTADDCNGHGTHVAGTVGGTTYGVAKAVSLVAVRVLNCRGSGTTSGVIAGIDWVKTNHASPAVANMSLGGGYSSSLNTAVANATAAGVTFAVAAGNSNADACNYSPASTPSAITVGATTSSDARASYSNYGSCLDIFAPGSSITSDWYTSNTATNTISGTSMASPHVAGAAALYLQDHPSASASEVDGALSTSATTGAVTSAGSGSPNLLLFVGAGSGGGTGGGTVVAVHPGSFSATSVTGRGNWKATVSTTVHNDTHGGVAGVLVTVGYTGGSQTWTCTTGTDGSCNVNVTISKSLSTVTFTLAGLGGTGFSWDGSNPHSLNLQATVNK